MADQNKSGGFDLKKVFARFSSGGDKKSTEGGKRRPLTRDEKVKEANKKKIILLVGAAGVAMVLGSLMEDDSADQPAELSSDSVVAIKDPDFNQATIAEKFMRDIKALQEKQKRDHEELSALRGELADLRRQQESSTETIKNALDDMGKYLKKLDARITDLQAGGGIRKPAGPPEVKMPPPDKPSFTLPQKPPVVSGLDKRPAQTPAGGEDVFDAAFGEDVSVDASNEGVRNDSGNKASSQSSDKSKAQHVFVAGESSSSGQVFMGSQVDDKEEQIVNPYAGYLSPGFMPAAIITGVSANTSQTAAANPAPVLMRVQGNVQLAGGAKYKLKSCFIFGSATGSMSEERAHIRLASISCVDKKNHRILEGKIKGYAVDSDGIFGIRGKLVERRADAIRNVFLAGGLQGLANVGAQAASGGVNIGGITQGTGIDGGAIAQSSVMQGFAAAAGKLAEFYLREAQAMFPVIEVPPGRKISLVVVEGTQLLWRDVSKTHVKQDK